MLDSCTHRIVDFIVCVMTYLKCVHGFCVLKARFIGNVFCNRQM